MVKQDKYIDKIITDLILQEEKRQDQTLNLIPSENYMSLSVRTILGSVLSNKYSEGYANQRYYQGNANIDSIEKIAVQRANDIFHTTYANVQPYSGSPANLAVYLATCTIGDTIMGLNLPDGGHLTHGWKASITGKLFKSVPYMVEKDGKINMEKVRTLALKYKPKLIWAGGTAYTYKIDYKEFAQIADEVGAYLAADISHIAGLIIGKVHPSPAKYVHIITTTTHKTLRGPRGALILVTQKGSKYDKDLPNKIKSSVFPALQGGPHNATTAAIAQCLYEASSPSFKIYSSQIIKNARTLASELKMNGLSLLGGGTQNHLMLIDTSDSHGIGSGSVIAPILEFAGIVVNKNTIPFDPSSPFYPSGIRLGTPAITSRGMKEPEMKIIAKEITNVLNQIKDFSLPIDKNLKHIYIQKYISSYKSNKVIQSIKKRIIKLTNQFPIPEYY